MDTSGAATGVLLAVAGLLLVGLPLLALAADRILPPPRRRPPPPLDTRDKLVRAFELTWQDTLEVEAAVREGRATRIELQPAGRAFAEHALAPRTFRGRPVTSYSKTARYTFLVAAVVVIIAYGLALGPEVGVTYVLLYGSVGVFSIFARRHRRRAAATALEANSIDTTRG